MLDFFVLIPCYNNLRGLRRSLASICYDADRFGILIVDDGSPEPVTFMDIAGEVSEGTLLHIIRLPENSGIVTALNSGLAWLAERGEFRFIARLDCGDLCTPDRFLRQVNFLSAHPEMDLIASWVKFRDAMGKRSYSYRTPVEPAAIERGMYFRNLFIHPALMWRAPVNGTMPVYPEDLPYAEDYGFVYEMLRRGNAAILPEELVICEINPSGLSLRFRRQQVKSRMRAVLRYGKNRWLVVLGIARLALLLCIPYGIILRIKSVKI